MFEKYSYKKKCFALVVIFFMLSIAAYKRSFRPLLEVISEHEILVTKADNFSSKSNNIEGLMKDIDNLNKTIGKQDVSKEIVQQGIVSFVTERHPDVSINELQPIHAYYDANYTLITNQLDVTGNVNQLQQLGYDFEKKFKFSRMVSLNFYTNKKNNKSESLHLKMIFQNYENNK